MRWAVELPTWTSWVCLAAASCTPREDLASYSGRANDQDLLPASPAPAASDPAVSPVPTPSEPDEMSAEQPAAMEPEVDETEPSAEGQTQPAGLADPDSSGVMMMTNPSESGVEEDPPAEEPTPDPPARPPPPAVDPPPPPRVFRFVRLMADSDVTQGPLTAVAELGVLGADGQPLPRTGWIASADSAEPTYVGGAPAAMAIDGDAVTMWHTPWFQVAPPPHPHFLQIDLGRPQPVGGFRYLARQDGTLDGRIAAYRFYLSADGVEWGEPVSSGNLANSEQAQDIRFTLP
jgi:F5/8 type C domain